MWLSKHKLAHIYTLSSIRIHIRETHQLRLFNLRAYGRVLLK